MAGVFWCIPAFDDFGLRHKYDIDSTLLDLGRDFGFIKGHNIAVDGLVLLTDRGSWRFISH